jgi:dienelactone hydrolase
LIAPAATLAQRAEQLGAHWDVYLPDGPGPFPVVVQLHGCGGKKPFQESWAEVARRAGVAAIVVDSHAPRAISSLNAYATVCTGLRLPGRERAGDLFAALAWARRQPWADPDRLAAAGWSHGGWTIADALSLHGPAEMARATGLEGFEDEPLRGLRAIFLVYPYLGPGVLAGRRWRLAPRTLAIIGGRDAIAGGAAPRRALARAAAQGAPVEIVTFETATHAFDEPGARDVRVRHDAALTARAHRLYEDLLRTL